MIKRTIICFKEDLERCNTHLIKCQLIELIIDKTWVSVKLGVMNERHRDLCGSKGVFVCNKRYNRRTSKAFSINSVNPKKVMRLRKQSCASNFDKLVIGRIYDKIVKSVQTLARNPDHYRYKKMEHNSQKDL